MAIQNRRGVYSDFAPTKMVPGELAVVQSGDPDTTSGQSIYAAFLAGQIKRLATEEDLDNVDTKLSNKVDKVTGKGLSTNDYTTAEKNKLNGIASGAEVNVQSDWNQTNTGKDDFIKNKPTKTSDFTNDGDGTSNFATQQYVQQNGGKIDTISVNGTQQPITNKNVDIAVPIIDSTLAQTGKAADAKAVGDSLASGLETKAPAITNTASGSIAHFEDGSDANAKSVIAHIEPVQDLHGYDSPWPAGGGKNLLNIQDKIETVNGVTATISNGVVTLSGIATNRAVIYLARNIQLDPGTYKLNGAQSALPSMCYLNFNSGNGTTMSESGSILDVEFILESATSGDTSSYIRFDIASGTNTNNLVLKPMIRLATETDPTFEPYSNICPISGFTEMNVVRTGENLIDDSIRFIPSTKTAVVFGQTRSYMSGQDTFLKAGTYTYSVKCDSTQRTSGYIKAGISTTRFWTSLYGSQSATFTLEEDAWCAFWIYDITTIDTEKNIFAQIESGSTASDYEPYQGQTYPITFPIGAGTVYGGYVDAVKGGLTAEMDVTDLSTLTWVWDNTYEFWRTDKLNNVIKRTSMISDVTDSICEEYKAFGYNVLQLDKTLIGFGVATTGRVAVRNGSDTVKPTNDMCYYLATPIEYNITPQQITTLLGTNNVWNDCNGDTDVEYNADTKLYIEQLTKPTEDDMTANGNIANATFFMIGNRLFLSTASIAVGETIVPGTNCTELSLADALNNLNA